MTEPEKLDFFASIITALVERSGGHVHLTSDEMNLLGELNFRRTHDGGAEIVYLGQQSAAEE